MYKIQKNVPIPSKTAHGRKKVYPFEKMEVGDSFAVPLIKTKTVTSAVSQENKKYKGERRYTIRVIKNKTRIWRIQ